MILIYAHECPYLCHGILAPYWCPRVTNWRSTCAWRYPWYKKGRSLQTKLNRCKLRKLLKKEISPGPILHLLGTLGIWCSTHILYRHITPDTFTLPGHFPNTQFRLGRSGRICQFFNFALTQNPTNGLLVLYLTSSIGDSMPLLVPWQ